jgi:hypothetical protein
VAGKRVELTGRFGADGAIEVVHRRRFELATT